MVLKEPGLKFGTMGAGIGADSNHERSEDEQGGAL